MHPPLRVRWRFQRAPKASPVVLSQGCEAARRFVTHRPRGKVFSHLVCPAKGARSARPALGKQEAGEEAGADAKAKAASGFLTDELRNGLAGRWAPLGYTALSLPIRHRRETAVCPPSPSPSPASCKTLVGSSLSTEGSGAVDSRASRPSSAVLVKTLCTTNGGERSWPRVIYCASVKSLRQEASAERDIL